MKPKKGKITEYKNMHFNSVFLKSFYYLTYYNILWSLTFFSLQVSFKSEFNHIFKELRRWKSVKIRRASILAEVKMEKIDKLYLISELQISFTIFEIVCQERKLLRFYKGNLPIFTGNFNCFYKKIWWFFYKNCHISL